MTITQTELKTEPIALDRLWYTRCPVPTASGVAHNLGWLEDEFAADGLDMGVLQDAPPEIAQHHFDHDLVGLFREGGNVPALVARSEGAPTRLVGLTWIDESQSILVRPDSDITAAADLVGARVAVPGWAASKARSFPRAMALHGFTGALATAGLDLDAVTLVEIAADFSSTPGRATSPADWPGLDDLVAGRVDAVYVKGARAAERARDLGLRVAVDLDSFAARRFRVNNGTPRPITVHERLLDERPDLVVRFLVRTLRAADWAADHLPEVATILARETRSGATGVREAYRDGFHRALRPDLSDERLGLLTRQADFLAAHKFLAERIDVAAWAAHEPLAEARRIIGSGSPAVTT